MASTGGHAVWLVQSADGSEVLTLGPGGERTTLLPKDAWEDLALSGTTLWLVKREGAAASLWRADLAARSGPAKVAERIDYRAGLFADGEQVYWIETATPAASLPFVPPAASVSRLKVREASGAIRQVAEWPGGDYPPPAAGTRDILGVAGDDMYVRLPRLASTEFLRVNRRSGEFTRVAAEPDLQHGAWHRNALYWTAPSDESNAVDASAVRRLGTDGRPITVLDWVNGHAVLWMVHGELYCVANGVYPVAEAPSLPHITHQLYQGATYTENGVPALLRDANFK